MLEGLGQADDRSMTVRTLVSPCEANRAGDVDAGDRWVEERMVGHAVFSNLYPIFAHSSPSMYLMQFSPVHINGTKLVKTSASTFVSLTINTLRFKIALNAYLAQHVADLYRRNRHFLERGRVSPSTNRTRTRRMIETLYSAMTDVYRRANINKASVQTSGRWPPHQPGRC